jgi:non-ribosomal peptide synthetase component F
MTRARPNQARPDAERAAGARVCIAGFCVVALRNSVRVARRRNQAIRHPLATIRHPDHAVWIGTYRESWEESMSEAMPGLMMDDFPLTLTTIVERAERLSPDIKVVSRRPDGSIHRTAMGQCAHRARRLASALQNLGLGPGDRIATLMWNQPEHLEVYFAVPLMGAVIHTVNPRLHPDELGFIVADAEDRAIVVDETLLEAFECFRDAHDFDHVIVVSRSGDTPDGMLDYDSLVDQAQALEWPALDERQA